MLKMLEKNLSGPDSSMYSALADVSTTLKSSHSTVIVPWSVFKTDEVVLATI